MKNRLVIQKWPESLKIANRLISHSKWIKSILELISGGMFQMPTVNIQYVLHIPWFKSLLIKISKHYWFGLAGNIESKIVGTGCDKNKTEEEQVMTATEF